MGNRTILSFSSCCEFYANNCLPITWMALFRPDDLVVETRHQEGEEFEVVLYRTSRSAALQRVQSAISRLKGHTPAWMYLRPLEVLRDELEYCSSVEIVELDVTQFWFKNETYQQRIEEAATSFDSMIDSMVDNEIQDLAILNQVVNDYSIFPIASVVNLLPEERIFVLIGTYWGEHEDLYSLDYFDEDYWTTIP